jgi:uncharacterized protein
MKSMLNWYSVPTTDFNRAVTFYNTIFAMEVKINKDPAGNDVAFFWEPAEDQLSGGITADPNMKPSPDGVRVYFNCDGKLDAVLERVEHAGGKITVPKMSIGEHGEMAVILDSEGNTVGLHASPEK